MTECELDYEKELLSDKLKESEMVEMKVGKKDYTTVSWLEYLTEHMLDDLMEIAMD